MTSLCVILFESCTECLGIYGSNLSANNDTLRSALESLRATLVSSLGDKCQSIGMIADIEGIVDCIDQKLEKKLDDLILEPAPATIVAVDLQSPISFAPTP